MANYNVDIELTLKGVRQLREFQRRIKEIDGEVKELEQRVKSGNTNPFGPSGKIKESVRQVKEGLRAKTDILEKQKKITKSLSKQLEDHTKIHRFLKEGQKIRESYARDAERAANAAKKEADQLAKTRSSMAAKRGSAAVTAGAFPLLFGGGAFQAIGGAIGGGLTGNMFGGATVALQVVGGAIDKLAAQAVSLGAALNPITGDFQAVAEAAGETGTQFEQLLNAYEDQFGATNALEEASKRLALVVGDEGVDALTIFGEDMQTLGSEFGKLVSIMLSGVADLINSAGALKVITGAIENERIFQSALRSADPDIRAAAKRVDQRVADYAAIPFADVAKPGTTEQLADERQAIIDRQKEFEQGQKTVQNQKVISAIQKDRLSMLEQEVDIAETKNKIQKLGGDILNEEVFKLEKSLIYAEQTVRFRELYTKLEAERAQGIPISAEEKLTREGLVQLKTQEQLNALITKRTKAQDRLDKKNDRIASKTSRQNKQGAEAAEREQKAIDRANKALDKINLTYTDRLTLQMASTELEAELLKIDQDREGVLRRINELREKGDPAKADAAEASARAFFTAQGSGIFGDLGNIADMPSFASSIEMSNSLLLTQEEQVKKLIEKYPLLGQAADAAAQTMTFGIQSFVDGTKTAEEVFADFLRSIADMLFRTAQQMIAQYIVLGVARAFGLGTTPSTPSFQSGIDAGLPSFGDYGGLNPGANFGIYVPKKALGGSVSSGHPYLVGERGPELFVPGAQGNIVPNNAMGGVNVGTINISVENTGDQLNPKAQKQIAGQVQSIVLSTLANERRSGGML